MEGGAAGKLRRGGRDRAGRRDVGRNPDGERRRRTSSPFGNRRKNRGRNDRARSHDHTAIHPPTAARPAEHQHRRAPYHGVPPVTPDSCIPQYLGRGTRIRCALSPPRPLSLGVAIPSQSPPYTACTTSYTASTSIMALPPPILTTGNHMVASASPSDLETTSIRRGPRPAA